MAYENNDRDENRGAGYKTPLIQRDCTMVKEISKNPQEQLGHTRPQYFKERENGE